MFNICKKYKRGLSPIVTTLFLFAVIIGAISVSLGIIYPAINELNDQIALETAGSSLQTLDTNIQNLLVSGADSEIFTEFDLGIGGAFVYNNEILSTVTLLDDGSPRNVTSINQPRLQIHQPMLTDLISEGEAQYFGGAGDQDYLFLNSTTRRLLGWSIINQSRLENSEIAVSSLSYRNILSRSFDVIPSQLQYNLTIDIHMINITLAEGSRVRSSGTSVGVALKFLGSQTSFSDWMSFNGDLKMVVTTQFPEAGSVISTERPLTANAPIDASSQFFVRYSFNFHQIEVSF